MRSENDLRTFVLSIFSAFQPLGMSVMMRMMFLDVYERARSHMAEAEAYSIRIIHILKLHFMQKISHKSYSISLLSGGSVTNREALTGRFFPMRNRVISQLNKLHTGEYPNMV